jgi:ParB family chromosome partitioning protein
VDVFFPGKGEEAEGSGKAVTSKASTGVLTQDRPAAAAAEQRSDGRLPGELPAARLGVPTDHGHGARTSGTARPALGLPGAGALPAPPAPAPAEGLPGGPDPADGATDAARPREDAESSGTAMPANDRDHGLVPVPGAEFAELPVGSIRPNPRQPRQSFDEESLTELAQSVREVGILQPVVVRRTASENGEPRYELIMGERRWRASKEAGLERVPAIIRDTSDDQMLRDALLENLHRTELNPLEEAAAYQQLLEDFGCTHEELATRIGRSRPQISNTIRLLRLPPQVQRRVAVGVLSAGHARALLGLDDTDVMERLAARIVSEGLSVRAVEEVVALGDGSSAKPVKRRPRAGTHTGELSDLASRLGDRLDTRVAISLGKTRGKMTIDFASVDDLNRILGVMSPDVRGVFQD